MDPAQHGPAASGGVERDALLPAALQARLAALEFALRRALPSSRRGDRRSPDKKGISLEFADYRGYVPGDDVRHLDWASYARFDQLIVKLYHDEEDAQLHLLIDASRSMAHGDPPKLRMAAQVAAALAWIALQRAWRVSLTLLGDEFVRVPVAQGSSSLPRFLKPLEAATADGVLPLAARCARFMAESRARGAIVLLSDLLDASGVDATLRALQRPASELSVIQTLARTDVEPDLDGDLRLIDCETGQRVEVNLSPAMLATYRERVRGFVAGCAETCRRRGAAFVTTTSDVPIEEFLLRGLVRGGLVR